MKGAPSRSLSAPVNPQRDHPQDPAADPGAPGDAAVEVLVEGGLLPGKIPLPLGEACRGEINGMHARVRGLHPE